MTKGVLDLSRRWRSGRSATRGSILAAVLVIMAIGAVWAGVASTNWSFILKREREKELIFRGKQIAKAIEDYSGGAAAPTSLEQMAKFPKPTLRQEWADPMTARYDSAGELVEGTGRWKLLTRTGAAATNASTQTQPPMPNSQVGSRINILPLRGVASMSEEESIGGYGEIAAGGPYSEWEFQGFGASQIQGTAQGGFEFDRPPGFGGLRQPGGPPVPPSTSASHGGTRPPGLTPPRPAPAVGGTGR